MQKPTANSTRICISKVWHNSTFEILLSPYKLQSNIFHKNITEILNIFNTFQKQLFGLLSKIEGEKFNITCLARLKNEMASMRHRVQAWIDGESNKISGIFGCLGQFQYVVQRGQMKALKEFNQRIGEFLKGVDSSDGRDDKEPVAIARIKDVQDRMIGLSDWEKIKIRDSVQYGAYERWQADFDLRAKNFIIKAYGMRWDDDKLKGINKIIRIDNQSKFKHLVFEKSKYPKIYSTYASDENQNFAFNESKKYRNMNQIEKTDKKREKMIKKQHIQKQQQDLIQKEEQQDSEMYEEQPDIVSQIYQQMQVPLKRMKSQ